MDPRPNVVFVLVDQLRASSLPMFGETQIATPHLDRLAAQGVNITSHIATCPVCTPYRGMLLTGRHPQTTGIVVNFVHSRWDEIGLGDVFARAGYRTGYIGKWHLDLGSFPSTDVADYVPAGRPRLGFEYWRAYNGHVRFFNGPITVGDDWRPVRWQGYETEALNRYAMEFMDGCGSEPFLCVISPHPPHCTEPKTAPHAPESCYARLPREVRLPADVPDAMPAERRERCLVAYRHYLAMILAVDDMMGELMAYLERTGRADNTLLVFTSDHGTAMGSHGFNPWEKKRPYQHDLWTPLLLRLPGVLEGGVRRDTLTAPVDFLPSLCALCGIPAPRTCEGLDVSAAWRGLPDAPQQDALLTMNTSEDYCYLEGNRHYPTWRGVRTRTHNYARWLDGRHELYDLRSDPGERRNLADDAEHRPLAARLEARMRELMARLHDELVPGRHYESWFDPMRRVIRNSRGPLPHPEREPDWSLLPRAAAARA